MLKMNTAHIYWGKKQQAKTTSLFFLLPSVLFTLGIKELKNCHVLLSSAMFAYTKENSFSRKNY